MKWEYRTVKLSAASFWGIKFDEVKFENFMNELGQQEWELVEVFATEIDAHTKDVVGVFKRPKQ
jgi:hypothetical protein